MIYYRRKILLALLDAFGCNLSNIYFQKILFLFCKRQVNPSFDFVPYKYGPFSFQSYQDRHTMIKYGLLANNNSWRKTTSDNYLGFINSEDREIILKLNLEFRNYKNDELIKYVYTKYPFYAKCSEIREKYSITTEILPEKLKFDFVFYTIGYEGKSIDKYLKTLIEYDVRVLCDVRKNPVSMKYGFSKNQLNNLLNKNKIKYLHIPELGIESDKRRNLKTDCDYVELLNDYKLNTLPKKKSYLLYIENILKLEKRMAITCFESNHKFCHRHKIAEMLEAKKDWSYPIIHL
jgi:hypothetical protein